MYTEFVGLIIQNVTSVLKMRNIGKRIYMIEDFLSKGSVGILGIEKMMEEDPTMTEKDALDYALNAKNTETNNKGFSAFQIVYGANPKVPGITNSSPASLESSYTNNDIKKHIIRTNLARLVFIEADNDERTKRALSSRINSYNEEFF